MPDEGKSRISLAHFFDELRKIIAASRELLQKPMPDTFLGRKTQEPFPKEVEK